ncbi:MAG: ThiF family adenylyltransferase [Candidatus Binatia bacterium]
MLSDSQIERYSRQIILPQVGGKGQEKLLHARVLICGTGGWQTQAMLYLAAAGVGTLGICPDRRSSFAPVASLFSPTDTLPVVLSRLNPDCAIRLHSERDCVDQNGIELLVQQYDLLLAEPDEQFHTASYVNRRPLVTTQVSSMDAWLMVCRGYEKEHPCLWCAIPRQAAEERKTEKYSPAVPFLGTLQATEGLKLILGLPPSDQTKMLHCNFPALSFREQVIQKNPTCSFCRAQS